VHVVADRFIDSSLAYQGVARGLGVEPVLDVNRFATGGLFPDRTVLLRLGGDEAARRRDAEPDRIEAEGDGFQAQVARGFDDLAARFPERIVEVDASGSPDEVLQRVRKAAGV
jgi:dTMP kinase